MMKRSSGILMPIFSLPSSYGIGDFGRSAYEFVDFLVASGQTYWQILPLGTLSFGESPYQSYSAFAGNPYFISLDYLVEEELLEWSDFEGLDFGDDQEVVDYSKVYASHDVLLRKAVQTFEAKGFSDDYDAFVLKHKGWLLDFADYMAIKGHFNGLSWLDWPDETIRQRSSVAISYYRQSLAQELTYHQVTQYFFFKQWQALKSYANARGIQIIGDMPIYVSSDSSDMWCSPQYFKTDSFGRPSVVAGYPPDAFSDTGQLWGNPIYDWEAMADDDYDWWKNRMGMLFELYDLVRIDHFLGFNAFWEIPAGDETARNGRWVKGPGYDLFESLKEHFRRLPIIAEDLGLITEEVKALLSLTGFPGMKILQFAYNPNGDSDYLPHHCQEHSVVYTGTHDHNTIKGWYHDEVDEATRAFFNQYSNRRADETVSQAMIRQAWSAPSSLAITPMQDLLELGGEARTNSPGTLGDNWQWRMRPDAITPEVCYWLSDLTQLYRRTNQKCQTEK
ncbi:4-alpha-glucanotransferase [Streptococcus merionis]|uniref:4-alpha-glucanotransferase n=1 Tax=Streptococcus merionis TaxID=400065 RepID=UPI003513D8E9